MVLQHLLGTCLQIRGNGSAHCRKNFDELKKIALDHSVKLKQRDQQPGSFIARSGPRTKLKGSPIARTLSTLWKPNIQTLLEYKNM